MRSVAVIGGGVVGLFCAYYSMLRGHSVTVFERGGPDHDCCSIGNAGMVVPSHFIPLAAPGMVGLGLRMLADPEGPFAIKPRLDPGLVDWCLKFARACTSGHVARSAPVLRDLNLASRALYEQLAAVPGFDFGLERRGLLMLCRESHTLAEETRVAEQACRLGIPAEALSAEQASKLDPGITMDIAGAVYFPQDCHLVPQRLVAALVHALEAGGAEIRWNAEVSVRRGSLGDEAVIRSLSGPVQADEIVVAGGAWSSRLVRELGLKMPMQGGKGYSITLGTPREMPAICSILTEARVAVTPMDGALRFAGTMEIGDLDASVNRRRVGGIVSAAARYFPAYRAADFDGAPIWSGLRPCSPDGLPYIGRVASNLTVATGHAMMGVSMAPITGKLVTEILAGEPPSVELQLLRPDRYA